MITQNQIASKLNIITLAIIVSFFWVTVASANLISYDLAGYIRFYVDQNISLDVEESHYTGILELDTNTHIVNECGPFCTGHRYSISYNIVSIDQQYQYQGQGELHLASLEDAFLTLNNFTQYYSEEGFNYTFDPQPGGMLWHDSFFDITSLISLNLQSFENIIVNEREAINSFLYMEKATVIPIPAAVWLFGSGLIGLIGVARTKKA